MVRSRRGFGLGILMVLAAARGADCSAVPPEFLADFLALQSSTIAPSYVSGLVCQWRRQDVLRALASRGVAAHIVMGASVAANTSTAVAAAPQAPSNALFQPRAPPPALLQALQPPALRALLLRLAARGRPGVPVEAAQAEEVLLDMTCPGASAVLSVASDMALFGSPFRWVLVQATCAEATVAASTPRTALVDSQVTVACPADEGAAVDVLEVHRPVIGAAPVLVHVASWAGRRLTLLRTRRGDIQRDMRGHVVPTGIALLDSNNSIHHLTDFREKELDQLTKTTFPILLQAYELMNATLALHVTNSHGYVRNGKFDGLLGDLFNGLVEIGGTVTLPVAFRMLALRYTGFHIPMRAVTVFRQPPLAYTDNVFWLPFPDSLWAASLLTVALCCVLTVVALRLEEPYEDGDRAGDKAGDDAPRRHQGAGRGSPKEALRSSFSDVFLLAFGAIAQQGSPVEARGLVGRLVTFVLFLAVLLIFTCYSASIVVLLQSASSSIRTLRDVWKSRLELGVENMPYNVYFIEQMAKGPDEVRRGLYFDKIARKGRPRNFITMTEGVRRLQEGLFAFVAMDSPLYGHIQDTFEEHEKCDLAEIDGYSSLRHPNLVTRRGSPITHMFKIKLLLQWERGLRARFILRSLTSKPRCDAQGARFTSMSFVGARSSYYVMLGGALMAVLVLLAELAHERFSSNRVDVAADAAPDPATKSARPSAPLSAL